MELLEFLLCWNFYRRQQDIQFYLSLTIENVLNN